MTHASDHSKNPENSPALIAWGEAMPFEQAYAQAREAKLHFGIEKELLRALVLKNAFEKHQMSEDYSAAQAEALLKDFCQETALDTEEKLAQYLRQNRQSQQTLVEKLFVRQRVEALKSRIITDAAVQSEFLARKPHLDRLVFQLIRTNSERQACDFYAQLKAAPDTFAQIAKTHSNGPEAQNGGFIGPVPPEALHKKLAQQLLALEDNAISTPFEIESTWLVARKIQLQQAKLDESLFKSIAQQLFEQWVEQQIVLAQGC